MWLSIYIISLIFSILMSLVLSSYAWQRRRLPGALAFSALTFLAAGWSFCALVDPYNTNLTERILWSRLRYTFGYPMITMNLLMIVDIVGMRHWLTRRRLAALLIAPAVMIIINWTADYHTLFRNGFHLSFNGYMQVLRWENGVLGLVSQAYNYCLGFIGTFIILPLQLRRNTSQYAWRIVLLMAAGLIPVIPDMLIYLAPDVVDGVSYSSNLIVISGILGAVAIFHGQFVELSPIAYSTLFAGMRDGVLVLDKQDRLVDMNRAARRILQLEDNSVGKLAVEVVPQWNNFRHGKITDTQPFVEVQLGQALYEFQLSVLFNAQGVPIGRTLSMRDITSRTRVEEALRLQSAALQASANAMVITDASGQFVWVNPAFTRLTGYTSEDIIGQTPRVLKSGQVDPAVYEKMWAVILGGQTWSGELINRRKDGSLYPEEQTITPLLNQQGRVIYFIAVKQDISERKALEKLREDMTHMLVHDLRNPLAETKLALQLLQSSVRNKPAQQPMIDMAEVSLHRMESLVSDILDISRLESGQMPLECETVELGPLAAQAISYHTLLAQVKEVQISSAGFDGLPLVWADANLLRRVLQNLIGNALKFTPEGGAVTISAYRVDDELQVHVRDTGPGISADIQDRLFEKFATSQGSSGFGLGLPFCHLVIEAHGGRIWG